MKEEIKEYTLDDLEDIIREYSSKPLPEEEKTAPDKGDTVRLDPVKPPVKGSPVTSDTKPLPDLDKDVKIFPGKKEKPAFSAPRQEPIEFPKNRMQQLRQKLENGPEKRHQELTRRSLGRLQAGLLLNGLLLLGAVGTTMLYYQVDESRLRMMIFGQILVVLLSALVGCRLLLDGIMDMIHGRFRLNSLLVVTFLAGFADGVLCLESLRLPFGAVFSLQMLMAQWAEYQRLQTEISQMDTLRKASDLTAVVKTSKYYQGRPAYQTAEGEPEAFMDSYRETPGPERVLCMYCLGAVGLSLVLALPAGIRQDVSAAVQVFAAALLAATPASVFIAICRPKAILEKRMHKLGLVLCGWKGLQAIEKRSVYPLNHRDLFPGSQVKLNGVRFYGDRNPNTVVSYVAALTAADGGCLVEPFEQLRSSRNARKMWVQELTSYPNGIGGQIDGMSVIAGTMEFMENMGVELPEGAGIPHAVYAAINQSLCAVFAVSFNRSKSTASGLRSLCQCRWVRPVLIDCDFVLTPDFLQQKLELDLSRMVFPDYLVRMELAEKKPEENAPVIALATREGLAQRAYAVTGGAALRSAWKAGTTVHLLGGGLGLLAVGILALTGAAFLLTPYNLLLYGCVWMIPGLLVAEWTRGI